MRDYSKNWTVTQRKDNLWTARKQFGYKENGKPNIIAFYGKTKPIVVNKVNEYETLKLNGSKLVKNSMTFEDYFLNWMKLYKFNKLKSTSYDSLEYCLNSRIKPYTYLSKAQMHQLTPSLFQKYFNDLATSDEYSYATIDKTKKSINNCLSKAVILDDIPKNPLLGVELVSKDKLVKQAKTIDFFDDDDIKLLIKESTKTTSQDREANYKTAKYYKPIDKFVYKYGHHIIFLMFTGLRIGEALALKWGDIDFENKLMTINNNLTKSYNRDKNGEKQELVFKIGSVKTQTSNRTVSLSQVAINALDKINRHGEYVFVTETGAHPDTKSIRRTLNTMQSNCNTKVQNSGLHVLRHTFASMLIRNNVDIKVVSEMLGHKKASTTYDIYVSLIPKQKQEALDGLDNLYL